MKKIFNFSGVVSGYSNSGVVSGVKLFSPNSGRHSLNSEIVSVGRVATRNVNKEEVLGKMKSISNILSGNHGVAISPENTKMIYNLLSK